MVKLVFNTNVQYEYDTETNKTRVLKNYTVPMGKGNWQKKVVKTPKQLVSDTIEEEYI